ncbi:MAG: PQQ-binding-like beta-propeller repeat protein, partial [Euryarchaeota archaeon]|nr:PQQ-binding-like beta-propeller repeat protein [Euryarchaeota archaeon]
WDGKIGPYSMSTGYGTNDFSGYFKINSTMVWKSPYLWTLGLHPEFIDEKFTIPKGNVRIAFGIYRNAVIWGSTLFTFYVDTIRLRNYTTPEPYATASMNRTGISIQKGENNEIYGNTILTGIPRNPVYAELSKKNRENLKAWWPMNEGSGTTLVDHSGNGHNGTIYGARWVSGIEGDALYFNGSNYANVNMTVNYTQLTVTLWFKAYDLSLSNSRLIANSHTDIDKKGFQVMFNASGQDGFFDVGNGTAVGNAYWSYPLKEGVWYFAALVYDGQTVKAYINGNLVGETKFAGGAIAVSNYPINIGRNPVYAGDYFDGMIDDVRIYNIALSYDDILLLYNRPVAWWTMDDGNSTVVYDYTGSGHNGVLVNNTTYVPYGVSGHALYFNGSNYVDVNMTVDYAQLTVTLWFNPYNLSISNSRLIANSATWIDYRGFQIMFNSGGRSGYMDVGNGTAEGRVTWVYQLREHTWYFAALVYDGSYVKAYIDGRLVGKAPLTGPVAPSNYTINIGRNPAYQGDYFEGLIDDVRIYRRALTSTEIYALYLDHYTGIELISSTNNSIHGNRMYGDGCGEAGVYMEDSSNNSVVWNHIIRYGSYGMYLFGSSNNSIVLNRIYNLTDYGIYLSPGSNFNRIYLNRVYNTHGSGWSYSPYTVQACDNGANNVWSRDGYGNYWYDWASNNSTNDQNNDGIVDWPYMIDGGSLDKYPLKLDTAGPWPTFHRDNYNGGKSEYSTANNNATLKWKYKTNGSVKMSPIIGVDGTVYVVSDDGNLTALYPNGTVKWVFHTGGVIRCTPTITADGLIYFASSDGYIYSLYPDGTLRWKYYTGGYTIYSSTTVSEDGILYVVMGPSTLFAIAPDGTLMWKLDLGDEGSTPAIADNGTIYVGSAIKALFSLYPNGTVKWKSYAVGDPLSRDGAAIAPDGTIYIGDVYGNLTALYPNGTVKWVYRTHGGVYSTPAIGPTGTIYFGDMAGYFYALYPNGTLEWSYYVGGYIYSSPAISSDGTVYFGATDTPYGNYTYALYANGTLRWKYRLNGSIWSSPAIGKDCTVYIGCDDGYLYAIGPPVSTLHLTAKSGVSWVNLTWTPSPSENITEYRIYRRTNNTTYVLIATVPASQLWYNDTNVTTNVTYYYYATAVNPSGESAPSNIVEATPRQVVPEFFSVLFVAAIVLCIAAASKRKFKNV